MIRKKKQKCSEPGCDRPVEAKGVCRRHYQRQLYRAKHPPKDRIKDPKPFLMWIPRAERDMAKMIAKAAGISLAELMRRALRAQLTEEVQL